MTDKEKLVALFTEFGVGFTEFNAAGEDKYVMICEEGKAKIGGYTGFFTEFYFDYEGKFLQMAAGE